MDSLNFDWLDNDKSMTNSFVASTPVQSSNASNDILQYLLQDTTTDFAPLVVQPQQPPLQPNQLTADTSAKNELKSVLPKSEFSSSLSVIQSEDNFVTFTPIDNPTTKPKRSTVTKKVKMKESIFVTESPQNSYKKKKKASTQLSSGEENSDDDMLLDEEFASSPSKLKNMSAKERRQLRNKISARNFRVRRKEYITQLEEKVELHEQTIEELKQENSKLRVANDELMKQLLNQPLTPPSSDNFLSSSGSEGNYSPETEPVASMFQFQLNDLYDLNLFDQAPPQESIDASNLFYLNHAVMPDWDIHQVLGEKGKPITSEEDGREAARNLIYEYPLLAPALMSIVVRHTLSLEYVTSIAKEFSESLSQQASEENLKKKEMLKIEPAKPCEKKKEEPFTEQEFSRIVYKYYLHLYLLLRARGGSHEEVMAKFKDSYYTNPKCFKKYKEMLAKKNQQAKFSTQCKSSRQQQKCNSSSNQCKASTSASTSSSTNPCSSKKSAQCNVSNQTNSSSKLSTLHTYCKVASTLLRNPSRMAHVNKVLRKEISFKPNKYTARIEDNYASMIGPFKNLRIANSS